MKRILLIALFILGTVVKVQAAYHTYSYLQGSIPNPDPQKEPCYKVLIVITRDDETYGEVVVAWGVHYVGEGCNSLCDAVPNCPDDQAYGMQPDPQSPQCFATLFADDSTLYSTVIASAEAAAGYGGKHPISTGISSSAKGNKYFMVVPSPLSGLPAFKVLFPQSMSSSNLSVQVLDASGKIIHQQQVGGLSPAAISLPLGTPSGIYFIRLVQQNKILQTERLTVH